MGENVRVSVKPASMLGFSKDSRNCFHRAKIVDHFHPGRVAISPTEPFRNPEPFFAIERIPQRPFSKVAVVIYSMNFSWRYLRISPVVPQNENKAWSNRNRSVQRKSLLKRSAIGDSTVRLYFSTRIFFCENLDFFPLFYVRIRKVSGVRLRRLMVVRISSDFSIVFRRIFQIIKALLKNG